MSKLSYSFSPDGNYFIFDLSSGRTLQKGISDWKTARTAAGMMEEKRGGEKK